MNVKLDSKKETIINYTDEYKRKLATPEEAAKVVKSGDGILYGPFAVFPVEFDTALAQRKDEVRAVKITSGGGIVPVQQTAQLDPEQKSFICQTMYYSAIDRMLAAHKMMAHVPGHLIQAAQCTRDLTMTGTGGIFVQQVSPMDRHGFFSFGVGNIYSYEGVRKAKHVILEVNPNMPRVTGTEAVIHISEVDRIIESNNPVFELPAPAEPRESERKIAEFLMKEIPDRACIQLGIGGMPNLLGNMIADSDLKDLGIHTELFVDSMVNMIESGRVTNRYKGYERGKTLFSFALGNRKTYDFLNDNPSIASTPGEIGTNPKTISLNDNMMAINNAIEIDLFSQVCSESSGWKQISGTGGQLNFVDGAAISKGGKSFICIESTFTDREGNVKSRIVPTLKNGSIVTTPRTSVNYIATEYGCKNFTGKATWHRAEMLIELAHPDFRDELIREAEKMNIWRPHNKIA